MYCPFLKGSYVLSCSANKEIYVPSLFEIHEYCKSLRYKMCPFYMQLQDRKYEKVTAQ